MSLKLLVTAKNAFGGVAKIKLQIGGKFINDCFGTVPAFLSIKTGPLRGTGRGDNPAHRRFYPFISNRFLSSDIFT